MKKFLNQAADMVPESLAGFAHAHGGLVRLLQPPGCVVRAKPKPPDKVALVSGGGSGHEPMHIGFVGYGMLDAACPGAIFTSPTPDQIVAAISACRTAAGALLIVKNYDGDLMNFEMAAELADQTTKKLVVHDEINPGAAHPGRGIAGTVVMEKLLGALAESGADLEQCEVLGNRINSRVRSFGVALSSCTVPALGEPVFESADNRVEWGVGIHGERAGRTVEFRSARELAEDMLHAILVELPDGETDVLLVTNGLGATPSSELYLLHGMGVACLQQRGVRVVRSLVGNFCTSLDTAGASFTVLCLDDELTRLWDAPVVTPALSDSQ